MFGRLARLIDPFAHPAVALPADVAGFLRAQLPPALPVLVVSLALSVIGAGLEVWLIGFAGQLVDLLGTATPATVWTMYGWQLLAAGLVVLVARPLAGLLREGLNDIAFRPNMETLVRARAHAHVLDQSVGWFRQRQAGQVLTQVVATGAAATGAIYSVVQTLVFVALYVVFSLLLMASIDPRLLLPLGLWLALYLALMAYAVPRYRRTSAALQDANAALTGRMVDGYANVDTLKLFADSSAESRATTTLFQSFREAFFGVQRVEVTMNAGMLFLGSLLIVGLVGEALLLWSGGAAPLGLIAVAVALSFRITGMGEWLLDAVSSLFGHLGTLRAALATVAQPLAIADAPDARPLTVTQGEIRFTSVSHHYGRGAGGLDGLTLTVAPGEKLGLVGRSGAGKSTLVNLLLRFFEAERGTIAMDGQDIRSVTQASLRRAIALVAQDPSLLHRAVRDNIAGGQPDVGDAAIATAAQQAAADGFIAGLRDAAGRTAYDALVGERGVTLSGGQRQRIALARALLKDAPILLLDEATSALDSELEASIQATLDTLMAGKTVIAIAHRLSTIARLDRLVVLDQGHIAEQGTHAALLAQGGIYARLWARQSGGFLGIEP